MTFQYQLIHSLKAHGNNIAIEDSRHTITYASLLNSANGITAFLLQQQVPPETVVGVWLPNRADLVAAMIGVMNARCVFVPVDGALPERRLAAMLTDLHVQHIITSRQAALPPALSNNGGLRLYFVEELPDSNEDGQPLMYPPCQKDDSLYIYYTSGSTGTPKGIVGKNSSLLQFVQWEINEFNIMPGTRVSQLISPYFDAFLRDVFVPLLSGGVICIPPADNGWLTPHRLGTWLNEYRIQLVHCVPGVFRLFNSDSLQAENFAELRYVMLSGEKIIPAELTDWYRVFGDRVQLVNFYGATETTMIRAFYRIGPGDAGLSKMPIGQPISDTRLLVAGENGKPRSPLIPGELYIISPYTAKGYLNAPELTHQKFLRMHAGTAEETIAFKSGDKARLLTDGAIELMGREDRQIKLNGIRIELDEIESVLGRCKAIKNCAVVSHTDAQGNTSLAAFIINAHPLQDTGEVAELAQQYLRDHLPGYMIPSTITAVDHFPLLSNGKIDYKELLHSLRPQTEVAPVTETEEKVLAIWKEILGGKPISTEDSFHSMGGSSIAMMRLIGRIYKVFNVRISLDDLFNNLTIKKQAALLNRAQKDGMLEIPEATTRPAYHLSAAQERLYYHYEKNRNSTAFNLPMTWEITGEAGKGRIENTIQKLIERHESLRTAFRFLNGELVQVVKDKVDFKLQEITAGDDALQETITAFVQPFPLDTPPLVRGAVITAGSTKVLVLDMHHIICDGMSQSILVTDFIRLFKGGKLPPLRIQYKDFAQWEQAFRATDEYISYREFWLKSFEGEWPALKWPTVASAAATDAGGNISFSIEDSVIMKIIGRLQQEQVTAFSGLFAVFSVFLSRLTGQDDMVIGINTSGRMQDELSGVVGMFVKTLPVRHRVDQQMPFVQYARAVHNYLVKANSRQLYDLANILSDLNRDRPTPVKNPIEAMFVYLDFDNRKIMAGNEGFADFAYENKTAKYPLTLFAAQGNNAFHFRLEYSCNYFTRLDAALLVSQFKMLVGQIAGNPNEAAINYATGEHPAPIMMHDDISFNF